MRETPYVEGIEPGLAAMEEQVFELGFPLSIQAVNLAIGHCRLRTEFGGKSFVQVWKQLELVSVAGDKPTCAHFDVRQRPETVPFDLKNPIRA